ncbi:hypothetical protein BU17DRAFT_75631 [Hysterangium stoloniferum]|nr:hypothetical protein BU17DRAFT_75631 [Hysterangium stoloniferum]
MAPATPPFPPSGGYIDAIRSSSRALRETSGVIISHDAIHRFLHSKALASTFKKLSQSHGLALPLNFPSQLAELNVISVLSLVNIGSGYRIPLHAHTGRGAWDSIRALILSLFITSSAEDGGDLLSATGLKSITTGKVASLMNVPTHTEKPHEQIPGVVVGELGGPLYDLVKIITSILNETGDILESQGYPDLGSFVLESLKEGERVGKLSGRGVDVEVVLEKIIRAIPAFRDMAMVNDTPIYLFKKALFLLNGITSRLSCRVGDDGGIPVSDTSTLPIYADNVIPSMLVHLGIIDLSQVSSSALRTAFKSTTSVDALLDTAPAFSVEEQKLLEGRIPKEGPILSGPDACILRAAAIEACDLIVEEAHKVEGDELAWLKQMNLPEIDAWIWAGAKDRPDYRELERFALRDTPFF